MADIPNTPDTAERISAEQQRLRALERPNPEPPVRSGDTRDMTMIHRGSAESDNAVTAPEAPPPGGAPVQSVLPPAAVPENTAQAAAQPLSGADAPPASGASGAPTSTGAATDPASPLAPAPTAAEARAAEVGETASPGAPPATAPRSAPPAATPSSGGSSSGPGSGDGTDPGTGGDPGNGGNPGNGNDAPTPPNITINPSSGPEDQAIALAISVTLPSPDPGETLSVTISGIPAGASLSTGTDNGDGTWTLTPAQLTGLTITPPADFSGNITLTITATSSLNGETESTSANLNVAVTPVADAPTLAVAAAVGLEDQPVALAISSALVAPAPGEVLSITVSGVPAGASLSAGTDNGDGTWTLTPAQLTGLTITPPADFSGNIALSITATSSVSGTTAATSANLNVTVTPVADAPTLAVAAAVGLEDQPIALAISSSLTAPAPGEVLSITVSGVPAGASLSAGTDNGDGTWTLTPAQLTGLTITPPADFSGNIPLTVTATSSLNGETESTSANLTIAVTPVADAPTLAVAAAVGLEDQPVALAISSALVAPAPGEVLSITVSGVPAGASLSAGTNNGDGTWTLTPAQLTGLTITPPADFSGNIPLTVTATSSLDGETESTSANLSVAITPVADAPTLAVAAAVGLEDQPVALAISSALVAPAPGEVLSVTVSGVPAGASLSAGTDNGDGTWTLTPAQLTGLTITPPADFSGNIPLTVTATSSLNGETESTSANLTIAVTPVADAPTLAVAAAVGLEDQPVALAISSALVAPAPGEVLSITVSGVPAGASLSAGTNNGDGTWTLTPAQLTGLTITPPENFSGSIPLTVTATSSINGDSAAISAPLAVTVAPVADAPTLAVAAAVGLEDQPVALAISSALVAPAPGEVLSITVSGVPAGASLSAGTDNGDGTWTLTSAQLTGLTITPPENFSGSIPLTVTATSSINGDSTAISAPLAVTVAPVADAPTLAVAAATGLEDQPVALAISSALVAPAPGEVLSITVSGVPAGASLSAGTNNGDGTWTLTPVQLTGLTITPPENFSGSIPLTVTATSSINGDSAAISAPLAVTVAPVADAPTLAVAATVGLEDQPVALAISSALVAPAPGEVLSVTVSGVPAGASLSAGTDNGDGTWTLTSAQLTGLTITPPENFSGSIPLTVTATSSINSDSAAISASLAVTVAPVADTPTLAVAAAVGLEDQPIALAISSSLTAPAPGEVLSITVSGVPAGASLSAGTDNGDGTWTLTPAQLTGLTITPPADFSGNIPLTVTATSSLNGETESTSANLTIAVTPVADAPTLAVAAAVGLEDQPVALAISSALVAPAPGEVLSVTVSGVPAGASLSAGTDNGDGTWTLTPAQLTGLTITPPADFSGSIPLTVTATSSLNGETESTSANLTIAVTPVADAPTLAVAAAVGLEDQPVALAISSALVAPAPGEVLSITVSGVPAGASLSAGTDNGDGTWTLTSAQLTGLTITPPENFSGSIPLTVTATSSINGDSAAISAPLAVTVAPVADAPTLAVAAAVGLEDQPVALAISSALVAPAPGEVLSITVSGVPAGASLSAGTDNGDGTWTLTPAQLTGLTITPPADFSGNIALSITATSSVSGTTAATSANLNVAVTPVADAPTLAVAAAVGLEDQPVALAISSALVAPAPGEVLSITVSGVPAGASLSAGTDNGDGTWTLSPAQLTGLTLTPPTDFSGSIPLTVTATSSLNGEAESTSANLNVTVTPVADAPTLAVAAAVGLEDQPVALAISSALVAPAPGEVLSITVSGVPAGASLSAGTDNGDGTWTLTPAQLTGLTITPPADFSGNIPLTVTATSSLNGETESTSANLSVAVTPVADAPTLAVAAAVGLEDQPVALAISSALVAPAPGEVLSITISGVPAGASLSAGTDNGDGTWTLTPAQLTGLTITPPADFSGNIPLTVTATSSLNSEAESTSANLNVTVTPIADAPTLAVAAAVGLEDQPVALAISSALVAPAPGEVLSITVSGVPAGASLSAGTDNGDGTWTLTPAQLTGLTITPPENFSGSIPLTVTATSSINGDSAAISAPLAVTVAPVADAPTLAVAATVGLEDQPVALAISSGLPLLRVRC